MMNKEKRNRELSLLLCLFCASLLTYGSAELETTTPYNWNNFASTPSVEEVFPNVRTCGSNLSVSHNASLLHFPKSTEHEALHCRWILTAPPGQKIAISSVIVSYNFPTQFVHWIAFNGDDPTDVENIISYTELKGTSIDGDWLPGVNDNPIISSSNKMLIDYISFGNAPFEAKMLFYSCGGTIYGHGSVRSPVFSFPNFVGTRLMLQCKWELIMEEESLFSSIQMDKVSVRDDCSVINVATNGIMKYILPKGSNDTGFNKNTTDSMSVMKGCSKFTFVPKSQNKSRNKNQDGSIVDGEHVASATTTTVSHVNNSSMFICSNNIAPEKISNRKLFVSGTRTIVEYTLPCLLQDVGFQFYFQSYPHYSSMLQQHKRPIYITYAGLLIWTPIGCLLGAIIICSHMRRRGPPKSRGVNIHKLKSPDMESDQARSGRCDVIVQATSTNSSVVKSIIKSKQKHNDDNNQLSCCSTAQPCESNNISENDSKKVLLSTCSKNGCDKQQPKRKFSKHVKFKRSSLQC